jgi:2-keto-4-pentenoate hydratase
VDAPVWGTVWDTGLRFCEGEGEVPLARAVQPRLEPECVFGMAATPPAQPSLDDLWACVAWVAPGFEIVQSHMKDWKFVAADTVADGGLHAGLLVGRRLAVSSLPRGAQAFEAQMAAARVTLMRGDAVVDRGVGANVLDGPLHALLAFVLTLREFPGAPDLQPGDVVTTGTWTDAWPVAAGETWRAEFEAPLSPLAIRFTSG